MAAVRQSALTFRGVLLALCVLTGLTTRAVGQDVLPITIPTLGWRPVMLGVGVVGVAIFFDARVAREVRRGATPGSISTAHTLDRFGEAGVIAPVVGGLALDGLVAHRPAVVRTAGRVAGAIVVASALTHSSKYLFGRSRPYQDPDLDATDFSPFGGRNSFPSGHTAAAFALATTLGDASGNTLAKIGLYTLATGTAWGRIAGSDHWLSDVLAGAGIGIVSAKFASGRIRIFGLQAPKVLIGPQGSGVSLTVNLPPLR